MAEAKFRISAKLLFVTYPQCPASKEDIRDYILEVIPHVEWMILAKEMHADGNPHLHVLIKGKKKIDSKNSRFLDFGIYHPNI